MSFIKSFFTFRTMFAWYFLLYPLMLWIFGKVVLIFLPMLFKTFNVEGGDLLAKSFLLTECFLLVALTGIGQMGVYFFLRKHPNKRTNKPANKMRSAYFYVAFLSFRLFCFLISMVVVRFTTESFFYSYSLLLTLVALFSLVLELCFVLKVSNFFDLKNKIAK